MCTCLSGLLNVRKDDGAGGVEPACALPHRRWLQCLEVGDSESCSHPHFPPFFACARGPKGRNTCKYTHFTDRIPSGTFFLTVGSRFLAHAWRRIRGDDEEC